MFELKDLDLICYVVGGSDDEDGDDGTYEVDDGGEIQHEKFDTHTGVA